MKKITFKPLNLLYNILVLAVLFVIIGIHIIYSVPAALITGTLLGFIRSPKGALFMPIQVEVWRKHIEGNLYKNNAFLNTFSKADKADIKGKTVHIPNAGTGGSVVKNRTVLPAEVKRRTDQSASYEIDWFTSDPITLTDTEIIELSYDKRASVLEDQQASLNETVAENLLLSVVSSTGGGAVTNLPATSILSTEGDAVAASAVGATGKVKAYTVKDLQRARTFFKRQNTWVEGSMYALLTAEAEAQMFPADSVVTATYMASVKEEERRSGVAYKAHGFQIISRSSVYTLDTTGAFKPASAESAESDVEGVIFYNGNAVEFAMSDLTFFEQPKAPTFYGDVFSFDVNAGGRAKRIDYKGILIIKQTPTV